MNTMVTMQTNFSSIMLFDANPFISCVQEAETDGVINPVLIRLWLARATELSMVRPLVLRLREVPSDKAVPVERIRSALGLGDKEGDDADAWIRQVASECASLGDLESGVIFDNLAMLGRRMGLSKSDQRILAFRVAFRLSQCLFDLLEQLMTGWTDISLHHRLGHILGMPVKDVEKALARDGVLLRSRLMKVSVSLENEYSEKIGVAFGLINNLMRPQRNVLSLMSFMIAPAGSSKLMLENYPHLGSEITLARDFLQAAAKVRRKGVNILLHGAPGTGKTELAKAICQSLGWTLFDIQGKEQRGDKFFSGSDQLRALITSQRVLRKSRRAAVLFDEIEGVLNKPFDVEDGPVQIKQFINEFMEETVVPTFWITNHPDQLDPAFVRRFDIAIAVNEPPRSVLRQILADACQGLDLPGDWIDRQLEIENLTPALIARKVEVARLASANDPVGFMRSFHSLLDQHFQVHGRALGHDAKSSKLEYDVGLLNASMDIPVMLQSLKQYGNARLLFHGAPGTGKSALAKAISREIDRPLQARLASDLLSPYVGQTEINLRHAFEKAKADQAVLLIDEADSFLQSRDRALRSWEVTQVNEFLTQVESFEGILICTTNYLANLDAAAMRRFDIKLEFKPLKTEQRILMFAQLCRQFGIESPEGQPGLIRMLEQLDQLTPGDFASVGRRLQLVPVRTAGDIMAALAEEIKLKPGAQGRSIGFLRAA